MKLHDLRPAPGSKRRRVRVGRGIAAGGGKTAGRGTKGQKARAGGSIPAWFEGGQTPLHQRIPKLRGFRNPFKTEYEVVNLGRIAALVELGALEPGELPGSTKKSASPAPITVNQEILRAVGLVRTLDKPLKVLGQGEIDRPLFVVADAFSRSAVTKIEAAGGSIQVLQVPTSPLEALGVPTAASPADSSAEASPEGAGDGGAEPARKSRAEARAAAKAEAKTKASAEAKPKASAGPRSETKPDAGSRDKPDKAARSTAAQRPVRASAGSTAEAATADDAPTAEAEAADAERAEPAEPTESTESASETSTDGSAGSEDA
jgi:large subunit ribosomal protein L15